MDSKYEHISSNMDKIVIKFLQGSAVKQTVLGELTMHSLVANLVQCVSTRNCETCLRVDKVAAIIKRCR